MKNYRAIADKYAADVCSGVIPACKWVRLACKRYIDDIERSKDPEFPYKLNNAKGTHACKFIERLPHVKGRWAAKRELLNLQPWQVWIVFTLFASVHKTTGFRRFRQAYVCVPRKNGKSPLAAAIALYMLSADGEHGAEVYCGATSEAQAHEVFRPAKQMVELTPKMQEALGISVNAKSLIVESNGSRFLPVIGKPGDGASTSCGICDEYHEATTPVLFDTFNTGMVGREQPLLLVITTAGTDIASPCYDYQEQCQKMLEGTFEDEQTFAVIYTIDADMDWKTEEALRMANPNYGISIDGKALKANQATAIQNAAKQNIFLTKNLNVWCNASVAWMNMVKWNELADPTLSPEQFKGEDCFVGLDLATKIDLAASVKLFRREVEGKTHYYALPRFYIPEERAQDPAFQHYQKWVHEGYLTATEGNTIYFGKIEEDLVADAEQHNVLELDFDQWSAEYLRQQFAEKTGVLTVQVPQGPQYLSDPAKEFEALVLSGRFHHDGNPVMTWCVSNVKAKYNSHDNLELTKENKNSLKSIDGVDALLNALYRALATPMQPTKKYGTYQRMIFV